jgi:hypothetical protein
MSSEIDITDVFMPSPRKRTSERHMEKHTRSRGPLTCMPSKHFQVFDAMIGVLIVDHFHLIQRGTGGHINKQNPSGKSSGFQ